MTEVTVTDNPEEQRYEAHLNGELAGFIDYQLGGGIVNLPHTEVFPDFGGRGVGSRLVAGALNLIRERGGLRVQPTCPFIRQFIDQHPDYDHLVAD